MRVLRMGNQPIKEKKSNSSGDTSDARQNHRTSTPSNPQNSQSAERRSETIERSPSTKAKETAAVEEKTSINNDSTKLIVKDLVDAVSKGDLEQLSRLVAENSVDLNSIRYKKDYTKKSLLCIAAAADKVNILEFLVKNGCEVNGQSEYGVTPLHDAALKGSKAAVEFLIAHGANVHLTNSSNETPIFRAAMFGYYEIVQIFINNGADIHWKDEYNNTPLHYAAGSKAAEIVKLFIKLGADVQAQNVRGATPLYFAAATGACEAVKLLLDKGAQVNTKTDQDNTPLHALAWEETVGRKKKEEDAEIAQLLIKHGADIYAVNKRGHTPIHIAAGSGKVEIIKLLLNKGCDINLKDTYGEGPLHMAAKYQEDKVIRYLLVNGANFNAKNKRGNSPLHEAFTCLISKEMLPALVQDASGHAGSSSIIPLLNMRIIYYLLISGSDTNLQNAAGKTAAGFAQASKYQSLIAFFALHTHLVSKQADFLNRKVEQITNNIKSILSIPEANIRSRHFHLYSILLLLFYKKIADLADIPQIQDYFKHCSHEDKKILPLEVISNHDPESIDQLYKIVPELFAKVISLRYLVIAKKQVVNILHFSLCYQLQTLHFENISFESFETAQEFFLGIRRLRKEGLKIENIIFDKNDLTLDKLNKFAGLLETVAMNVVSDSITFNKLVEHLYVRICQLVKEGDSVILRQCIKNLNGILSGDQYKGLITAAVENTQCECLQILLGNAVQYYPAAINWETLFDKAEIKSYPELLLIVWQYSKPSKYIIIEYIIKSLNLFFPKHQTPLKKTLYNFIRLSLYASSDLEDLTRKMPAEDTEETFVKMYFPHRLINAMKSSYEQNRLSKDTIQTLSQFQNGDLNLYQKLSHIFYTEVSVHIKLWLDFLAQMTMALPNFSSVEKAVTVSPDISKKEEVTHEGIADSDSKATTGPLKSFSQFPADTFKQLLDEVVQYDLPSLIESMAEGREAKLVTVIHDTFVKKYAKSNLLYKFVCANFANIPDLLDKGKVSVWRLAKNWILGQEIDLHDKEIFGNFVKLVNLLETLYEYYRSFFKSELFDHEQLVLQLLLSDKLSNVLRDKNYSNQICHFISSFKIADLDEKNVAAMLEALLQLQQMTQDLIKSQTVDSYESLNNLLNRQNRRQSLKLFSQVINLVLKLDILLNYILDIYVYPSSLLAFEEITKIFAKITEEQANKKRMNCNSKFRDFKQSEVSQVIPTQIVQHINECKLNNQNFTSDVNNESGYIQCHFSCLHFEKFNFSNACFKNFHFSQETGENDDVKFTQCNFTGVILKGWLKGKVELDFHSARDFMVALNEARIEGCDISELSIHFFGKSEKGQVLKLDINLKEYVKLSPDVHWVRWVNSDHTFAPNEPVSPDNNAAITPSPESTTEEEDSAESTFSPSAISTITGWLYQGLQAAGNILPTEAIADCFAQMSSVDWIDSADMQRVNQGPQEDHPLENLEKKMEESVNKIINDAKQNNLVLHQMINHLQMGHYDTQNNLVSLQEALTDVKAKITVLWQYHQEKQLILDEQKALLTHSPEVKVFYTTIVRELSGLLLILSLVCNKFDILKTNPGKFTEITSNESLHHRYGFIIAGAENPSVRKKITGFLYGLKDSAINLAQKAKIAGQAIKGVIGFLPIDPISKGIATGVISGFEAGTDLVTGWNDGSKVNNAINMLKDFPQKTLQKMADKIARRITQVYLETIGFLHMEGAEQAAEAAVLRIAIGVLNGYFRHPTHRFEWQALQAVRMLKVSSKNKDLISLGRILSVSIPFTSKSLKTKSTIVSFKIEENEFFRCPGIRFWQITGNPNQKEQLFYSNEDNPQSEKFGYIEVTEDEFKYLFAQFVIQDDRRKGPPHLLLGHSSANNSITSLGQTEPLILPAQPPLRTESLPTLQLSSEEWAKEQAEKQELREQLSKTQQMVSELLYYMGQSIGVMPGEHPTNYSNVEFTKRLQENLSIYIQSLQSTSQIGSDCRMIDQVLVDQQPSVSPPEKRQMKQKSSANLSKVGSRSGSPVYSPPKPHDEKTKKQSVEDRHVKNRTSYTSPK